MQVRAPYQAYKRGSILNCVIGARLKMAGIILVASMFNFSANHLFLLSRMEYRSCAVFLMLDRDTQRVYRLLDFTKRLRLSSDRATAWRARSTVRILFTR